MESEKKTVEEQQRELAKKYAEYLRAHDLKPGDATFVEPEDLGVESDLLSTPVEEPVLDYEPIRKSIKTKKKKTQKAKAPKTYIAKKTPAGIEPLEKAMAAPLFFFDKISDKVENAAATFGRNTVVAVSKITSSYTSARKTITAAVLAVCVLSAVMLVVFDKFTVYEYAYNGKVLGYVDSQDDVTNVLDVAGEELSEINTETDQDIEFTANDNISFKRVVASGKDIDDADATVNKLAYMTDVEVEASGIYDGNSLVTVVKDQHSAETLLADVKAILGEPDKGMEVEYVDFSKPLDIRPVNVLLTSVQSYSKALNQMTNGGDVKFYHLVENDETATSIAKTFGVELDDIYDENNKEKVNAVSSGDKVCIRKSVEPVSVELVETGKMKEIIPYETIRKDTKDLYIGDEEVGTEGVDGVQIFDGTVTKVGGKVVKRDTNSLEVITEKVDEVILVGITERPKTAPTGTFINPMVRGSYVVTSRPGWRWGRTHEGVDMGARVGTPVYASDGGRVIRASWYSGYGNCIDIQHADGWISRYGHLSYYGVSVGDEVYQGQYIADVGNTGRSTGPHLHFEIRHNGVFVDPDTKVDGGL